MSLGRHNRGTEQYLQWTNSPWADCPTGDQLHFCVRVGSVVIISHCPVFKNDRGLVLYKYLSVLSTVKHFNSFYNLCTVWRFKSVHCSFDHASTQVSHKIALKEKFTKIFKFNKFDTRAIEFLFSLHVLSP